MARDERGRILGRKRQVEEIGQVEIMKNRADEELLTEDETRDTRDEDQT